MSHYPVIKDFTTRTYCLLHATGFPDSALETPFRLVKCAVCQSLLSRPNCLTGCQGY
jgi:hypothetical protein